uniref:Uncharacterized protein n=1 Tax=Anguilla anguilla TaxID=7936 RepID=A0A0E9VJ37_ANGAN
MIHHFCSLAHVIYSYGYFDDVIHSNVCLFSVCLGVDIKVQMHFVIVILQWKV